MKRVTAFARLAALSSQVSAARGTKAKVRALVEGIGQLDASEHRAAIAFLVGELPMGKIGVGPSLLRAASDGLAEDRVSAQRSIADVVTALTELAAIGGKGSSARRLEALRALFAAMTTSEASFLAGATFGELRQGAIDGVMLAAIAEQSQLPLAEIQRAAMLSGSTVEAAVTAIAEGRAGLARFVLTPFVPVLPMLASPGGTASAAVALLGRAIADVKLDGARIQVHRVDDEVRIYTRSLDDVTARLPEVVEQARSLACRRAILDGEAIALRDDGSPHPFATTMQRFGRKIDQPSLRTSLPITGLFFDVLLIDDDVLLDAPLAERRIRLEALVPPEGRVSSLVVEDTERAEAFFEDALSRGHEGILLKDPSGPYEAGHRGARWLKVKPAHELDLVVLAVEHGSGRRRGWLSNLHLGARDPSTGAFVMVGKTFKGLTDEMLRWQTEHLGALAIDPAMLSLEWGVVTVRPELVVEIAVDSAQRSSEYESGLSLRFARVRRHRPDKSPRDVATLDEVRALAAAV